jgi:hypothetical protein
MDMHPLIVEATSYTPEIRFDAQTRTLSLKGESYPENAAVFFSPVFEWVKKFLAEPSDEKTTVDVELYYFNSSSSKMLLNFFEMFDKAAADGMTLTVNWIYHTSDSDSVDFCEEFEDDLDVLKFTRKEIP